MPGAAKNADREAVGVFLAAGAFHFGKGTALAQHGAGSLARGIFEACHIMDEIGQIGQHDIGICAGVVLFLHLGKGGGNVAAHDMVEKIDDAGAVGKAQHGADIACIDLAGRMGNRLVEHGQGVAHRAFRRARNQAQRLTIRLDFLCRRNPGEMLHHSSCMDAAQVKALAA